MKTQLQTTLESGTKSAAVSSKPLEMEKRPSGFENSKEKLAEGKVAGEQQFWLRTEPSMV